MKQPFCICIILLNVLFSFAQEKVFPGADEKTPSRAQYFSWINNTNEGATEEQTLINLDFFKWLKDEYGMQLDIYAFDAGAIDGKRFYGNTQSERFKRQFPNGFDPMYKKAKEMNTRLGIWGGPDGFGDTPQEAKERIDMMVALCRDYDFALFKFDQVCGPLREEKEDYFIEMMKKCREYSSDLILLNHRLGLNRGLPYATTFLWEGAETYIDIYSANHITAPHHRAGAMSRGLTPGLQRLTEDHGVCLSSCLDNWDDELILQVFSRNLILSPEIYGNPWLLRDDEYPKLARIFNMHSLYKNIIVDASELPENEYGKNTVARGNDKTRLIAFRNLGWTKATYSIAINDQIGLKPANGFKVIQLHPFEQFIADAKFNSKIDITVEPFRSALIIVTAEPYREQLITGAPFNIVRNTKNKSVLIDVLGMPGTRAGIGVENAKQYSQIKINGVSSAKLINAENETVTFDGNLLQYSPYRKLAGFETTDVPGDAETIYEATVFSSDNNALEVRELIRSGETKIPQVRKARDAFFDQQVFINRGLWDKNLFDGNLKTSFINGNRFGYRYDVHGGAFRIDLGKITAIDQLHVTVPDDFSLSPLLLEEGNYVDVSKDMLHWRTITFLSGYTSKIEINDSVRYLRFNYRSSQQISEVEGFYKGKALDRSLWRASNLFAPSTAMKAVKAWVSKFTLDELAGNSYLCVALNGVHGREGAYVGAKIDGRYVGATDRAPCFQSNTWESMNRRTDKNYTYYIPMKKEYLHKPIEVYVLGYDKENLNFEPEVWLWSHDPYQKVRLELVR